MYNEEIKKRFIREYTSSISAAKAYVTTFDALEQFEIEWNADLCTKGTEELQRVVDNVVGLRARSKWSKIIMLKDYVRWCMDVANVAGACDGMLKITSVGLDKIKQQTVSSPLHLQRYLDKMYDEEDMNTTDNIYRCFYWLAYGGVSEDDILKIKCSDVDFTNMVIHYHNTEIPIYREAIKSFKKCVELSRFVYNHPNYTKTVWKDRADGDTIVRGIRSVATPNYFRVEISRRAKENEDKTGIRLSYYRAWISGVFYRVYEKEAAGDAPDFSSIVSEQMSGKTYKLDAGRNTQDAKKRQLVRDYIEDYQRWKLAFKI